MSYRKTIEGRLLSCEPIREILEELEQTRLTGERERAEADPEAHRLTLVMERGKQASWKYWDGGGVPGSRVRYGYTCWRNAAGYFLSFREVWDAEKGEGYRDKWVPHRKRRLAADTAKRWAAESLADAMRKSGEEIADAVRETEDDG